MSPKDAPARTHPSQAVSEQIAADTQKDEGAIAAMLQKLRGKPWDRKSFFQNYRAIYRVKGMLGQEERRALYWIARHCYRGSGAIVDAGAYVGASAYCLAAGLVDGRRAPSGEPVIHSYDYFAAIDDYVASEIARAFGRPMKLGDDTLHIFKEQVREFAPLIRAIPGDFLETRWTGGPIEILFVDIAKTRDLNSHVVREFMPHLIPGRSLLIQQDFGHPWHSYIQISMEMLSPYFETLDGHIKGQSRLYWLKKAIPPAVIEQVAAYGYSAEEKLAALDALVAREKGEMRAITEVIKLSHLIDEEKYGEASAFLDRFVDTHRKTQPKGLWWQQAQDVARQLGDHVLAKFAGKERA